MPAHRDRNALCALRKGPPWAPQGRRDHSRWASDLVTVLPAVYPTEHKWIYLSSAALPRSFGNTPASAPGRAEQLSRGTPKNIPSRNQ